jgi:HAMP domain-containing protein
MGMLLRKFRIGEKIGIGFGIVGVLFLGVIWQYHNTLQHALNDYRQLDDVYGERKEQALLIENSFLRAQRAEKNFKLSREESYADEVQLSLQQALRATESLEVIDGPTAIQMRNPLVDYRQRFENVLAAWRIKGLDHNSGLQGAFRDSAHELEQMAAELNVDRLYLLLLQIRRSEKDLGLRREQQYQQKVEGLIRQFSETLADSALDHALEARLFHEIDVYRETFDQYAARVLRDSMPVAGKGPFREAAHRIEALLEQHYLSGLGEKILQLRRREKDYLLRHDNKYADMAIDEMRDIAVQLDASAVSVEDKARFTSLLNNYRGDFLALVEQNQRIDTLDIQMLTAVSAVAALVVDNVSSSEQAMAAMRLNTDGDTASSERAMLWVVVIATVLGIVLACVITLQIVRPVRRMDGLLDQLASEEPAARIHFYRDGRDEINAMAGSVNAIADHKAGFIAWWKASMRQAEACGRIEQLIGEPHSAELRQDADKELREAVTARKKLLWRQYDKMYQLIERIIDSAGQLQRQPGPGRAEIELNTIRYSARSVQTMLEMASTPEIWQRKRLQEQEMHMTE